MNSINPITPIADERPLYIVTDKKKLNPLGWFKTVVYFIDKAHNNSTYVSYSAKSCGVKVKIKNAYTLTEANTGTEYYLVKGLVSNKSLEAFEHALEDAYHFMAVHGYDAYSAIENVVIAVNNATENND